MVCVWMGTTNTLASAFLATGVLIVKYLQAKASQSTKLLFIKNKFNVNIDFVD